MDIAIRSDVEIIWYPSVRPKRLAFFFLLLFSKPILYARWQSPSVHGNHACFFFFGLMAETFSLSLS